MSVSVVSPGRGPAAPAWARRAPDTRFDSLDRFINVSRRWKDESAVSTRAVSSLSVTAVDDHDLQLHTGEADVGFTNYSFRQLCSSVRLPVPGSNRTASPPADYLATLPAHTAAELLNYGLGEQGDREVKLVVQGGKSLRCLTGPGYGRVWDCELAERCASIGADWQAAPTGLYASDRNSFLFLVNESRKVPDGTDDGLSRGIIVENSEVGCSKFRLQAFLYRYICENHVIFGMQDAVSIELSHTGERARGRIFEELVRRVTAYSDGGTEKERAAIVRAQSTELAPSREELVDLVYGREYLTKTNAEAAYDLAEQHEDNPRSAWGYAQGITRLSQRSDYADERTDLDRAAARVLAFANN